MLSYLPNTIKENSALNLNIFIAHGEADNVLNHNEAIQAKAWLDEHKYKATFKSYKNLSHSIAQEEIQDLLQFINKSLQ